MTKQSGKSLVIVESPTKAKTIGKFLGSDYEVLASYGHIRDLPGDASEIPAEVKKEKWSRIGINVDKNFEPLYIIPNEKKKRVKELRDSLKGASRLFLATDEDREGESISWHLLEVLKPKVPVKRLVFHEITKEAIQESINSARQVDEHLVKAQETRRIIDRLFGYGVSPLLWKKVAPRLSAGRVQTVAIKLLVERERERITFKSATYSDLKAVFEKRNSAETFEGELIEVSGQRVASGKDFDPKTGKLANLKVLHLNAESVTQLRERLLKETPSVKSIEEKPFSTKPSPPFTTSTLQQEGSRKLGYAARRTMQVAQSLYENGFITYMRTDSTNLSNEALAASRTLINRDFGPEFLTPTERLYKTKVKNAQEAHEAIRPAGSEFATFDTVREKLGIEAVRLYELIWKRTIASQMKDAVGTRVSVMVGVGDATFRAAGKTIQFPGYLRAYVEGSDDPEADLAEQEKILPQLTQNENLKAKELTALEHATLAPARYTEGTLIKELERLGIGRPSTWATIVDLVLSRDYAFKKGPALVPTFLAMAITGIMENYFTDMTNYDFTAKLEDELDEIARGERDNLSHLKKFYFGNGIPGLLGLIKNAEEKIDPRIVNGIPIGVQADGTAVEVRIGRYGPFISNGTARAVVPDGVAPDEMTIDRATELLITAAKGPEKLGTDPESGLNIYVKTGRFGPYVQLGEQTEGGEKPKMASLMPGMKPETVDLALALKILEYPKVLGKNPESGEDILASNGRYGPYIKCGSDTRSIPTAERGLLEVDLPYALELLKQPKKMGRGRAQPTTLKDLGKNGETSVSVKAGRYGPYVTDGTTNASLPRGADPAALTMDEALSLLSARAAKILEDGGVKRPGRGKKKFSPSKVAPKEKTTKVKAATIKGDSMKSGTVKGGSVKGGSVKVAAKAKARTKK